MPSGYSLLPPDGRAECDELQAPALGTEDRRQRSKTGYLDRRSISTLLMVGTEGTLPPTVVLESMLESPLNADCAASIRACLNETPADKRYLHQIAIRCAIS